MCRLFIHIQGGLFRALAVYVRKGPTQKTDKKTSRWVYSLSKIALNLSGKSRAGFLYIYGVMYATQTYT